VRREQLLDAAEEVLLERGLAATTMADVAAAANVAKGTIYLYFESKAELLAGLRARYLERFTAALDGGLAAGARARLPYAARIERLVAASYDFAFAHHRLHHLLLHQAGFSEQDVFARARSAIATLIEAGVAAGELEVPDPALATDFVLSGLHGTLVTAIHQSRSARDRERLVGGASELILRALRARG
jgi:TetR/AcrR family transcriptional repressor of nem operon